MNIQQLRLIVKEVIRAEFAAQDLVTGFSAFYLPGSLGAAFDAAEAERHLRRWAQCLELDPAKLVAQWQRWRPVAGARVHGALGNMTPEEVA